MLHLSRIVNGVYQSNTYVISADDSKDVWLVDIGDAESVIRMLGDSFVVKGVFLTHTHYDHIYGINKLYSSFPEIIVYVSDSGISSLFTPKRNLSYYHNDPLSYQGECVIGLREGDYMNIYPNHPIIAHETPGHSIDSMTYQIDNWLFSGDAYIPSSPIVTKLPGGDRKEATFSKARIIQLAKDRILCPGHGEIQYL